MYLRVRLSRARVYGRRSVYYCKFIILGPCIPRARNVTHCYRGIDLNISLSNRQDRELVKATPGAEAEPSRSRAEPSRADGPSPGRARKRINHVEGVLRIVNRLFQYLFHYGYSSHMPPPRRSVSAESIYRFEIVRLIDSVKTTENATRRPSCSAVDGLVISVRIFVIDRTLLFIGRTRCFYFIITKWSFVFQ